TALRENKIRYHQLYKDDNEKAIFISFDSEDSASLAVKLLNRQLLDYDFIQRKQNNRYSIQGYIKQARLLEIKNSTVEKSITTLRNRVNELGVSEAVVQRQGINHIVVEL